MPETDLVVQRPLPGTTRLALRLFILGPVGRGARLLLLLNLHLNLQNRRGRSCRMNGARQFQFRCLLVQIFRMPEEALPVIFSGKALSQPPGATG